MPAELVVMTAEMVGDKFKVYRTPLHENDSIPRTGILFMVISVEDSVKPRLNGRRRLCESCAHDYYTLIVRKNHVLLAGWDQFQFVWKGLVDPWLEASTTHPDHLPMARAITFEGVLVSKDDWLKAVDQAMAEMH